jgi:MoxR-like ATPase
MQERQVSIGEETFPVPSPFMVLATQNPIEQEGTYPLPEAQLDRFMLKLKIDYPNKNEERQILERMAVTNKQFDIRPVIKPQDISGMRSVVDEIYIDEKIKDYIINVVCATREPNKYGIELGNFINYGASPRATIHLAIAAKAHAFIQQRGYVTPQDVKSIGLDVLRHRVIVSYEAEAENKTSEDIIKTIFDNIEVP